jgi:hypothetical protein
MDQLLSCFLKGLDLHSGLQYNKCTLNCMEPGGLAGCGFITIAFWSQGDGGGDFSYIMYKRPPHNEQLAVSKCFNTPSPLLLPCLALPYVESAYDAASTRMPSNYPPPPAACMNLSICFSIKDRTSHTVHIELHGNKLLGCRVLWSLAREHNNPAICCHVTWQTHTQLRHFCTSLNATCA